MRSLKALLAFLIAVMMYLLLWPVPVDPVAWDAPQDSGLIDPFDANNRLEPATTIDFGTHHGPEDVTTAFRGLLYSGTEDGNIVSFRADGSDLQVFSEAGGRPLGLEYAGGYLYVANAYLGLQRIAADGSVEALTDEYDGQPIKYADDVAVAQDGVVYFSDASSKFGAEEWAGSYGASLLDILEHGAHGRVFKYDPSNRKTSLLMEGLNFANGVAVCEDQSCLLVNETGSYRVWRHWLQGEKQGSSEIIIDNLPGFPDNINNGLNGRFWIGIVAPRSAILDKYSASPFVRKMMQRLPAALRPRAIPSTHLIAIDRNGNVLMNLQDTRARFPAITGAFETGQFLYLSTLFGNSMARLNKENL